MSKSAAYHGVQNVKFFPKTDTGYGTGIPLKYAKSLSLTALLEAVEQYADNMLIFRVPKDDGYDAQFGSTAQDVDFETAAGYVLDSDNGIMVTNVTFYSRGAFYFEYIEADEIGVSKVVKNILFNVEVGKAAPNYQTDTNTVTFGDYVIPLRVYGDNIKSADGETDYKDENGMTKKAFIMTCRKDDSGYAAFGTDVPVPKVKSEPDQG